MSIKTIKIKTVKKDDILVNHCFRKIKKGTWDNFRALCKINKVKIPEMFSILVAFYITKNKR